MFRDGGVQGEKLRSGRACGTLRTLRSAGRRSPLPRPNPRRIVVFGDTGCRIEGKRAQACNNPNEWPFPKIAAIAARAKADLVLHVGDYLYREGPCPQGN